MVRTESGIRDLLFMPLLTPPVMRAANVETMEIVDVDLEVVPKQSDIRELTPRKAAPSSTTGLASLVDAYEARADRAAASPKTEELDLDAIEEEVEVAKRSAAPPLPQPRRAPIAPVIFARARRVALNAAWQSLHLARRWPELWDLDTRTKVAVIAVWMAFFSNLTLLVR